ncbi:uncharacterized protein LOC142340242 isoform X2 [Convolutriloba macropyga]|uniref:uncharacterized protein LOC142340242 isoform X2 n=1 Tax=Convolutriloba macropyga TaxID=536237 RepID=UPI003F522A04
MYRKQEDAMSFGGLQFLADSRSKMQNLSQEADHLETRYKSYSERLSMLAQETYKLPSSNTSPREVKKLETVLEQPKRTAPPTEFKWSSGLDREATNEVIFGKYLSSGSNQKKNGTTIGFDCPAPESKGSKERPKPSDVFWPNRLGPIEQDSAVNGPSDIDFGKVESSSKGLKPTFPQSRDPKSKWDASGFEEFEFDLPPVSSKHGLEPLIDDFESFEAPSVENEDIETGATNNLKEVERNLEVLQAEVDEILEESFNYSDDLVQPGEQENVNEGEGEINQGVNVDSNIDDVRDMHAAGDVPSRSAPVQPIERSKSPEVKEVNSFKAPEEPKRTSFRNVFAYSDAFDDDDDDFGKDTAVSRKKNEDFFSDSDDNVVPTNEQDKKDVVASQDEFGLEGEDGFLMAPVEAASFDRPSSVQFEQEDESEVSF